MDQRDRRDGTQGGAADYAAFVLDAFGAADFEFSLVTGALRHSPRLNVLFGYSTQRPLTTADCLARCHPDDRVAAEDFIAGAWARDVPRFQREFRIVMPDGAVRWVLSHGAVVLDHDGRPDLVRGVALDITERKRVDVARRASQEQLRLALDIAELGTWSIDLSTGAGELDERGAAIVGLPQGYFANAAEAQRMRVHPDDLARLESDLAAGIAAGGVFNLAYRVVHLDGSIHYVASRARVIADETGRPARLAGTNRDVTDERMAEAALRESEERYRELYAQEQAARAQAEEASRLKDEFVATVSHELRTPLTAFLGYAQLLQRRSRDAAYVARTVEKMVQSAQAQAELIEDLLDVSRIVSGKLRIEPRPTALGDVVSAALDTVRPAVEAKGLNLHVELDPACGAVLGDANRLQQVVWNLLSNAAKFTPPGGQIVVRLVKAGDSAELSVRDTGRGIPEDFLPYIFDRFSQADSSSQRSYGGLGLGLALVRHLVELHGGAVEARSAGENQGATLIVRLPLAAAVEVAEDASGDEPGALRGLRVLVVDDQPVILGLLEEILASEGATVLACVAASDALALLRESRPDVLVTDIAMPEQDGYWLIQQVRGLPPHEGGEIPAVALTAYGRVEDRLQVLAAGFQEFVPKPVEPAELRDVVARLAFKERER